MPRLMCVILAPALMLASAAQASAQESPTLAQQLGEIVAGASYESLSEPVRRRLALTIEDNLASLALATPEHCADPFLARLRRRGGLPEAWVPGCGFRLPAEEAAAAIAYLIHANETDDSDFRGELRASPPIFGAALAAAQAENTNGRTFSTALANGYSVQGALADAWGPLQPRYMSSGVWGPIGAAAASATALDLDAGQSAAAIALSASAASGPFQYFYDQTNDKRIIIARGARAGVEAAFLARYGETGAPLMLEGRAGVYAALDPVRARNLDTQTIAATAARLDGPLYLYPKFFAASSSIIPFLEPLAPVWRERSLSGVDVAHFTLFADPAWAAVLADKIIHFEAPTTEIGAKINFAYVLALFMMRGSASPHDYDQPSLSDPTILDLARRARFQLLPEGQGGRLEITLHSGDVLTVTPNRIDPRAPAPEAAILRDLKFEQLTRRLTSRQRDRLRDLAAEAANADSMLSWTRAVDMTLR